MSVQSVAALPDHRPDRVTGARVARLEECIAAADDAQRAHIAEEFWQEAAARGTPLVEELDGEPDHRAVTFLWRGHRATRQVLLMVSHLGDRAHLAGSLMEQVPGTDIWHFGLRLRADHRASYRIAADVSAKEPPEDPEVLQARLRSSPCTRRTTRSTPAASPPVGARATTPSSPCPRPPPRRGPSGAAPCPPGASSGTGSVPRRWVATAMYVTNVTYGYICPRLLAVTRNVRVLAVTRNVRVLAVTRNGCPSSCSATATCGSAAWASSTPSTR